MGTINGISIFTDTTCNSGTCTIAQFADNATNSGTVINSASFADQSRNLTTVVGTATFSSSASNTGDVQGLVVFSGEAVNTGTVQEAVFLDQSKNLGTVQLTATFSGTSRNEGNVQNAVFVENTTTNVGTVVAKAVVPVGFVNTGTIAVSSSYSQLSGAYSYGYFNNAGNKTAPPSYETVAYNVNNIWYKYDANGNAVIANGNYSDGSNDRVFRNGIKLDIGTVTINGAQYYYELPLEQSKTIYTSSNLSTKATKLSGVGWGVYIDGNDVEDEWIITSSGVLTWTNVPRSGAYVEGYYFNNGISTAYNNNTPQVAKNRDNSYFVYSLGLPTSADGAYTNGYYVQGLLSGTFVAPQSAKDNNSLWYLYVAGASSASNGAYSNGYYSSGTKGGTYTIPQTAIDDQLYYSYAGGVATKASGSYTTGFFANGILNPSYTNNTPVVTINANYYIVYTGGVPASADGYYSNGVYAQGAAFSFSSLVPYQAIDSEKWYIYTTGVVTATANGPYSTGYFVNGDRDNYYTNQTAQIANDDGEPYKYNNGTPTLFKDGAYSYGYYVNSQLSGTFTLPQTAIDRPAGWFTYTSGVATSATGAYTTGYFVSGTKTSITTPQSAKNQTNAWYVYTLNAVTSANGGYTNFYFVSGKKQLPTGVNIVSPVVANDSNLFYYWYGTSTSILADGPFTTGYYKNGTLSANAHFPTPISTYDTGLGITPLYLRFVSGVILSADGAWTAGYFVNGAKTGTYTTPQTALDSPTYYYTYANGTTTYATGAFTNGYFNNAIRGGTYTTPQTAKDQPSGWYTYTNGYQTSADGPYSNGYFSSGTKTTNTYTTPQSAKNQTSTFYLYTSGNSVNALSATWYELGNAHLTVRGTGGAGGAYAGKYVVMNQAGNRVGTGLYGAYPNDVRVYQLSTTSVSANTWVQLGNSMSGQTAADNFGGYTGGPLTMNAAGNIIIGASTVNDNLYTNAGMVRAYQLTGTSSWVRLAQDLYGEAANDFFGSSVACNSAGNILAVGATDSDPGGKSAAGTVMIFQLSTTDLSSTWVQLGSTLSGINAGEKFGSSVAINAAGDRVAVGSPYFLNRGKVTIYNFNGTDWTLSQTISTTASISRIFGTTVSFNLTGNRIAIGDPGIGVTDMGLARAYEFDGTTWNMMGSTLSGETNSDYFASVVKLNDNGDYLIASGPFNDGLSAANINANPGSVRAYGWTGTTWAKVGNDMDNPEANSYLGNGLAIDGSGLRIAAGAYYAPYQGSSEKGYVRVYQLSS